MSRPVLLLGVAPRCGTNFAAELLALHPACGLVRHPPEDGLAQHLGLLDEFVDELVRFYRRWPDSEVPAAAAIRAGLLDGVVSAFAAHTGTDVSVLKTPFSTGIERIPDFLPEARVVLTVRDGRDVVESTRRSWGSPLDVAAARWRDGVRNAASVLDASWLHVVRYEDLLGERSATMRSLLDFLALDPEVYPFDDADGLAIFGSSTHGRTDDVSWKPVDPSGFTGTGRSDSWSDRDRAIFALVAGAEQRLLGYPSPAAPVRAAHRALSVGLDVRRRAWAALPPSLHGLRRR